MYRNLIIFNKSFLIGISDETLFHIEAFSYKKFIKYVLAQAPDKQRKDIANIQEYS